MIQQAINQAVNTGMLATVVSEQKKAEYAKEAESTYAQFEKHLDEAMHQGFVASTDQDEATRDIARVTSEYEKRQASLIARQIRANARSMNRIKAREYQRFTGEALWGVVDNARD